MIKTYKELYEVLNYEKKLHKDGLKENIKQILMATYKNETWKYIKALRYTEYFKYNKKFFVCRILYIFFCRRKNILGRRLNIDCHEGIFDKGVQVFHTNAIIINGYVKIGKNCKLHGNNCIGNDGKNLECPIIGNNVDIGNGAKIIGNIKIADNIKIAAGAVVVSSFEEEGVTIAGIPAKIIKK